MDSAKRATSKSIGLHVLTAEPSPRDVKTGCQAAADRTSQSLEMCLPVSGREKKSGGGFLARGHAAEALDVI